MLISVNIEFTKVTLSKNAVWNVYRSVITAMSATQGVYSDMYMTGGLGPDIFWDTQKSKYQEKSDPKK